jgi:hypothetical protein
VLRAREREEHAGKRASGGGRSNTDGAARRGTNVTTVRELLKVWDFFDQAITGHGFTAYNRDYRLDVVFVGADKVEHPVEYLFRGCVEAHYESRVVPPPSAAFMDDRFIDFERWEAAGHPKGFVWGVNHADAYPGLTYVENSERAASWARSLSLPMHEVTIETNTYLLRLVFHDLRVQSPTGWRR